VSYVLTTPEATSEAVVNRYVVMISGYSVSADAMHILLTSPEPIAGHAPNLGRSQSDTLLCSDGWVWYDSSVSTEIHFTRRGLEHKLDICYKFVQGGKFYFSSLRRCEC